MAATAMPERATQAKPPSRSVASTKSCDTRARVTNMPAWAWPARKKLRCSSVAGWRPRTTRSMNAPPDSIVTRLRKRMPAMTCDSLDM